MLGLRPSRAAFGGVGKAKGEPCEALAKQGAGLRKNKNKDTSQLAAVSTNEFY